MSLGSNHTQGVLSFLMGVTINLHIIKLAIGIQHYICFLCKPLISKFHISVYTWCLKFCFEDLLHPKTFCLIKSAAFFYSSGRALQSMESYITSCRKYSSSKANASMKFNNKYSRNSKAHCETKPHSRRLKCSHHVLLERYLIFLQFPAILFCGKYHYYIQSKHL